MRLPILAIITCWVVFVSGCSSPKTLEEPQLATKQQVIDELTKVVGKEHAEETYQQFRSSIDATNEAVANRDLLWALKFGAGMKQVEDATKNRLLKKTDHQAVLIASRQIIRTRHDYSRDPRWFGPDTEPGESLIAADDPKLPKAIKKLQAASIIGYDDRLVIEFGGGFHHQGFIAFAESATNAPPDILGFRKLIDGLWFYEDTH